MITKIFPFIEWFKDYSLNEFKLDIVAGLTVALVLIPQSMAYAQLAGLPAYYGLYASFLPPMIASLFGSSRQLATGPVAIVSLMTAASLEPLATAGSQEYIAYAILLALVVGIFQFLMGVLRLGLIVELLSHPVISGFTVAGAIIIATSQLSKMFGVYVDRTPHRYQEVFNVVVAALEYTHWPTLLIGLLAIAIQIGIKRYDPRIPSVLVAVIITTVLSWAIGFEHNHRASISAIEVPVVRKQIGDLNKTTIKVNELAQQRAEVNKEIEELEKTQSHSIDLLDLKHKVTILTFEIDEMKHRAYLHRKQLRKILLSAVVDAQGKPTFYLPTSVPEGAETDGYQWRFKVGERRLEEDSLLMTGGGAVVGTIPEGLPSMIIPKLDIATFIKLLPYAIIITLLGFMEAIAIAKAMAAKTGQKIDTNQELRGQGLANIIGAIGQSYPVSGSFSRSSVNLQNGGVTGLSNVISALMVVVVLLFFTPLLYHLPQSVLASVIMLAVLGLVRLEPFVHAWRVSRADGVISVITFFGTLYFAPNLEEGIIIGVILTLAVFLFKSMRPRVATLSLNQDKLLRDSKVFKLKECKYISVIRFDGRLFFANANYLDEMISKIKSEKPDLKHILIIGDGINDLDASGEEMLANIVNKARTENCGLSLCGLKEHVMNVLKRSNLLEKIGEENIYFRVIDAVDTIFHHTHEDTQEAKQSCPLMTYLPEEV
ncbi:MAG: STAS domain-containing protein [Proteobacteria bacterium]|nr:STAS domain-containing protein [Pseudomonadota bacterium]